MLEVHEITTRQQWLELRQKDVTASDIAAAAGVSPYKTAAALYAEKLGLMPPPADNAAMQRGRWFEDAAIRGLREIRTDWDGIRKCNEYYRDTELRIGCTPDVEVRSAPGKEGRGIIQIKSVASWTFEREWMTGDDLTPPLHYQLQTLTEAKLTGAKWAYLVALVTNGMEARLEFCEVDIDDAAWERLKASVATFWGHIDRREPPEIDAEHDAKTVRALWRKERDTADVLDLTGNNYIADLLAERKNLMEVAGSASKRLDVINTEIAKLMKDAPEARLPGWRITYKSVKRKGYVVEAGESRQLRVYSQEEKAA